MNELIKQIRKQINPPRKSASETGIPFRSRVINGARKKEDRSRKAIGFEIPVTRGAFDRRKEAPMTNGIMNEQHHWPKCPVKHRSRGSSQCRKVGERKQLEVLVKPRETDKRKESMQEVQKLITFETKMVITFETKMVIKI